MLRAGTLLATPGAAPAEVDQPVRHRAADLGRALDTVGANRADLVGDPHPSGFERGLTRRFNTAAFAQPPLGVYGNSGRNILRGPGVDNLDLALFKNFELPRGGTLQLRLESFNALNHPQWANVSRNIADRNFGVVTSPRAGRVNQLGLKLIW